MVPDGAHGFRSGTLKRVVLKTRFITGPKSHWCYSHMTMSLFLRGQERFILRERGGDGGEFYAQQGSWCNSPHGASTAGPGLISEGGSEDTQRLLDWAQDLAVRRVLLSSASLCLVRSCISS